MSVHEFSRREKCVCAETSTRNCPVHQDIRDAFPSFPSLPTPDDPRGPAFLEEYAQSLVETAIALRTLALLWRAGG